MAVGHRGIGGSHVGVRVVSDLLGFGNVTIPHLVMMGNIVQDWTRRKVVVSNG